MASLSGSGSGPFIGSNCWPQTSSLKTHLWLEKPPPSSLMWLLVGGFTSLPCELLHESAQDMISPKPSHPRKNVYERQVITEPQKRHAITSGIFCWSQKLTIVQCRRGIHKGGTCRSTELSRSGTNLASDGFFQLGLQGSCNRVKSGPMGPCMAFQIHSLPRTDHQELLLTMHY